MSLWSDIAVFIARLPGNAVCAVVDAVRSVFAGDPERRRKVAFSIAMIALSAKMAKADGIVTPDEIRAFGQIFAVPVQEERNVARIYNLAKQDVAGFEAYATRVGALFASEDNGPLLLEDVIDGLFHIAKADGVIHEHEASLLARAAEIFGISARRFDEILARHVLMRQGADPFAVLGLDPDAPPSDVRKRYLDLVRRHHPDKLLARGMPEEFIAIATRRLAAINAAYEAIEAAAQPA